MWRRPPAWKSASARQARVWGSSQPGERYAPSVEALREHLRQQLPDYMVPRAFVRLEQLPLTANGKVDRQGLPAPGGEAYGQMQYEAPQGEIEAALAQIWQELLRVERVGREDNFFAARRSLAVGRAVVSRVEQVLGRELSVRALFEQPTIRQLAAHLEWPRARHSCSRSSAADRPAMLPLSWSQQRLWFIDQLEGGSAAYHVAGRLGCMGCWIGALRAGAGYGLWSATRCCARLRLEQGRRCRGSGPRASSRCKSRICVRER